MIINQWEKMEQDPDYQSLSKPEREYVQRMFLARNADAIRGVDPDQRAGIISRVKGIQLDARGGLARAADSIGQAAAAGDVAGWDNSLTGAIGNATVGRKAEELPGVLDSIGGFVQNNLQSNPVPGFLEGMAGGTTASGVAMLDPVGRAVDAVTLGTGGKVLNRAVSHAVAAATEPGASSAAQAGAAALARLQPHLLGAASGAIQGGAAAALGGQNPFGPGAIGAMITGAVGLHGPHLVNPVDEIAHVQAPTSYLALPERAGGPYHGPIEAPPAGYFDAMSGQVDGRPAAGTPLELTTKQGFSPIATTAPPHVAEMPPPVASAPTPAAPVPTSAAPAFTHALMGNRGGVTPVNIVARTSDGRLVLDDGRSRMTVPSDAPGLVANGPGLTQPHAPGGSRPERYDSIADASGRYPQAMGGIVLDGDRMALSGHADPAAEAAFNLQLQQTPPHAGPLLSAPRSAEAGGTAPVSMMQPPAQRHPAPVEFMASEPGTVDRLRGAGVGRGPLKVLQRLSEAQGREAGALPLIDASTPHGQLTLPGLEPPAPRPKGKAPSGKAMGAITTAAGDRPALEPWQMTKAQYLESTKSNYPLETEDFVKTHLERAGAGKPGLSVEGDRIVLRDEQGQPLGATTMTTRKGEKMLNYTVVRPDARRQGVATRLFEEAARHGYAVGDGMNVGSAGVKHKYFVEKAMAEGKPVPAEVQADYPGLTVAPPAKPPAGGRPGFIKPTAVLDKIADWARGQGGRVEDRRPAPVAEPVQASPLKLTSEYEIAKRVSALEKGIRNVEAFQKPETWAALPREAREKLATKAQQFQAELAELRQRQGINAAKATEAGKAITDQAPAFTPAPDGETTRAGNINLDRIETRDDIKAMYQAVQHEYAPQIDHARRGEIGQGETRKLADDLGMSVDQLIKRRRGQAFNAEEALAARRILAASATHLEGLARTVRGGTATDAQRLEFRRAMELHAQIQAQVAGATAEAGRALASFRITAHADAAKVKAIHEMLDQLGGRDTIDEIAHAMEALDDPAKLATFVRNATKPRAADKLAEYYINSILSGPPTLLGNAVGNSLVLAGKLGETLTAAAMGKLLGTQGGVKAGEAKAQLFGMTQAAREALTLGVQAFKTEEAAGAFTNSTERAQQAIGGAFGRLVRLPSRFLTGTDVFFKMLAYRAELNGLAYRQAAGEGRTGDHLAQRVAEIMNDPSDELIDKAQAAARYHTFNQALNGKGPFASADALGQGLTMAKAKVPALSIFLPFVRTPLNIVKYGAERTPIALLSRQVRADIAAGGAERDLATGKIAFGSMLGLFFGAAARAGLLTGAGPSDPQQQATLRQRGWQPYSLKVGDQYFSYTRLAPYGMLAGMAADLATGDEWLSNKDKLGYAGEVIRSAMSNFGNQTFFKGLKDLADALSDPDHKVAKYVAGVAGGFAPNLLNKADQAVDPTVRDTRGEGFTDTIGNAVAARVPGLAQTLPAKLDAFGHETRRDQSGLEGLALPFQRIADKHNPALNELARLGVNPEVPGNKLTVLGKDLDLTPELQRAYLTFRGPINERVLMRVVSAPGYQRLSDEQKREVLKQAQELVTRGARDGFIAQHVAQLRPLFQARMAKPAQPAAPI